MRYWVEGVNKASHTRVDHSGRLGRPAKNSVMIVMAEDKKAVLLMEEIRQLQEKMEGVGLKAFCLAVDECD